MRNADGFHAHTACVSSCPFSTRCKRRKRSPHLEKTKSAFCLNQMRTLFSRNAHIVFHGSMHGKTMTAARLPHSRHCCKEVCFYQTVTLLSLGTNSLFLSVTLKALYHASICGKAPFTLHRPRAWGSLFVRRRISSSLMFAAQTLA